ncbi:RNA polymerase sigma factor SigW [Bacillus anthracis]|nr:RNA polymerase sigma factor SigW [Bacillus anthracis]
MQTYRHYIFQVIFSILRHEEDAKDVTQEVFVKIHASLPNYQFRGLKTWMLELPPITPLIIRERKLEKMKNSPYVKKLRKI